MPRTARREPMSKVDTAWLRMEQPTNLMMITGVVGLDDPIDMSRLLETLEQRFLAFRRFRQKAVLGPTGAWWEFDEDFDIRTHVRRVALPGKADRAELETLVAELASTPLDHSRPLWQFHVVENAPGGPALISRIHHCIADGIARVQVFLSLTDPTPEGRPSARDPDTWRSRRAQESNVFRRLLEPARDGVEWAMYAGQTVVGEALRIVEEPTRAVDHAAAAAEVLQELVNSLTLSDDPPTRFKGRPGVRKQAAWAEPLDLSEVKAVSRAFGCTVNDVLISAVTGALRAYLLERGDALEDGLEIRATVPVNLRRLEHARELGNHFGLVFLPLPVGEDNPLERLYRINASMNELKASKQAAVAFGLLQALGMGPGFLQKPALDLLSRKATAVLTNVPGPRRPLWLAGSQVRDMMFWVPQNGTIGLGISILSYAGKVFFGLITDRRLVPNPGRIIERFHPEFEKLLYLGMMLPLEGRPSSLQARGLLERALEPHNGD